MTQYEFSTVSIIGCGTEYYDLVDGKLVRAISPYPDGDIPQFDIEGLTLDEANEVIEDYNDDPANGWVASLLLV